MPKLRRNKWCPETALAAQALELFKASGVHVAMVVDEYGGITGLLTLNDLLEEIIGDLDQDEPDVILREDGSWLVDGVLSIHRLEETLPDLELPEAESGNYATLSGFIMMRLGRVPAVADHFEWGGFRFEVIDMDRNRIDKVLVQQLNEAGEKPETASPSDQKGE
ncbi:MAG: CBS domain-containing protein [Anaerolineae bacterium]|nr:CBS domain-containing protein [Anaerolineae bacterium]